MPARRYPGVSTFGTVTFAPLNIGYIYHGDHIDLDVAVGTALGPGARRR